MGYGPIVVPAIGSHVWANTIVPVSRVKPHTDYDGDVENGRSKMTVIGFGKQRGAKRTRCG